MIASPSSPPRKSFLASRPCLFVFESNIRVLNYLKRTFSTLYDLRLFSEDQPFLHDLETMHRPSLVLMAWDGIDQSMPLFARVRSTRPEVPVLILATTAEMADYEVFARHGASGVVLKPFVDDSLEVAIAKHLLVSKDEAGEPKEIRLEGGHSFVRSSKRMREVEAQAQLVARSDVSLVRLD
jgi:two-component system response regulator AtoC